MEQRLIVEGKDAIVLANICKLRNLAPPKGYSSTTKFTEEFVIDGKGYSGALIAFGQTIEKPNFNNIGLIIDANQTGVIARWQSIKTKLVGVYPNEILNTVSPQPEGIIIQGKDLPTVGVWIMPNNQREGYLEHFIASMIQEEDKSLAFAKEKIEELISTDHCSFTEVKKQKALVHTWLAWQESPGLPIGTAVQSGYFDVHSDSVDVFVDWFQQTFVLE